MDARRRSRIESRQPGMQARAALFDPFRRQPGSDRRRADVRRDRRQNSALFAPEVASDMATSVQADSSGAEWPSRILWTKRQPDQMSN